MTCLVLKVVQGVVLKYFVILIYVIDRAIRGSRDFVHLSVFEKYLYILVAPKRLPYGV